MALIKGTLATSDYSDAAAQDPAIDLLRSKMEVREDADFSRDYLDPNKRAIANRIEISMKDGLEIVHEQAYPLGHPRRREEAKPLLMCKFEEAASGILGLQNAQTLMSIVLNPQRLDSMSVLAAMIASSWSGVSR